MHFFCAHQKRFNHQTQIGALNYGAHPTYPNHRDHDDLLRRAPGGRRRGGPRGGVADAKSEEEITAVQKIHLTVGCEPPQYAPNKNKVRSKPDRTLLDSLYINRKLL